jgi:hypothetical protein
MSEEAATTAELPLVADRLADFSDRLSPMLVKELRQGLRAKTFVIVFLTLQGLLGLVLLTSIASASAPQNAGETITSIIFMFFSLAVLVIQPIRGIGALHREVQGQTIELMVLTRLSAWKIVLGKWVSIVSQSALIFAAIVPYLILRYWFGDMNLLGEVSLLCLVFVLSAAVTAVIVGISCVPSVILRGLLPLLAAAMGLWLIPILCFENEFDDLVTFAAMQSPEAFWGVTLGTLCAVYIGWTALGVAASMIAPAAENHSTVRRLLALGLMLLLVLVARFANTPPDVWVLMIAVILVPSMIIELTEPFILLPPICRPFVERGAMGRLAGRLLYPGWPSGVIFTLLMIFLATLSCYLAEAGKMGAEELVVITSFLGSLLMPAAVMCFFDKRIKNRLSLYLLLISASAIVTIVLALLVDALPSASRGFLAWLSWLPQTGFIMVNYPRNFQDEQVLLWVGLATAVYASILPIAAMQRLREVREVEAEALTMEAKP